MQHNIFVHEGNLSEDNIYLFISLFFSLLFPSASLQTHRRKIGDLASIKLFNAIIEISLGSKAFLLSNLLFLMLL